MDVFQNHVSQQRLIDLLDLYFRMNNGLLLEDCFNKDITNGTVSIRFVITQYRHSNQ